MTPLARKIALQLTLPVSARCDHDDEARVIEKMDDVHCFDCTNINYICYEFAEKLLRQEVYIEEAAFLPAPKTWIELRCSTVDESDREAFLLIEDKSGNKCDVFSIISIDDWYASHYVGQLRLYCPISNVRGSVVPISWEGRSGDDYDRLEPFFVYALLSLINAERGVSRRVHAPHKTLQKRLLAQRKVIGRFPLHAWTEIVLPVGERPSPEGAVGASGLTGERCLHFVRKFRRTRLGRTEYVRAHWRGDGSLGIKRSRYRLDPSP